MEGGVFGCEDCSAGVLGVRDEGVDMSILRSVGELLGVVRTSVKLPGSPGPKLVLAAEKSVVVSFAELCAHHAAALVISGSLVIVRNCRHCVLGRTAVLL